MRDEDQPRPKRADDDTRRGFAMFSRERLREVAGSGGRKAHEMRRAHQFSSDEAKVAGAKGGKAVSANREHMAAIGRKGGEAAAKRRAKRARQRKESGDDSER